MSHAEALPPGPAAQPPPPRPRPHPGTPRPRQELLAAGRTEHELRTPVWDRAFHGLYVPARYPLDDELQRIREAAELLPPGAAIGGWAAARLLGAPELDGRDPARFAQLGRLRSTPDGRAGTDRGRRGHRAGLLPVTVCTGPGNRIRERPGVRVQRSPLGPGDVVVVRGIPVTSPLRTLFDLARGIEVTPDDGHLRRLMAAVADVDAVLRATGITVAQVQDYLSGHRRWNGVPFAREVLSLADADARSRPESALRVVWTVLARLPRPVLNRPVYDAHGFLLGYPDLLDPLSGLVAEYDGAEHRGLLRHTDDNAREEAFERHNLVVVRATSIDLYVRQSALARRLVAGHEAALARDPRRDDWYVGSRALR